MWNLKNKRTKKSHRDVVDARGVGGWEKFVKVFEKYKLPVIKASHGDEKYSRENVVNIIRW